MLNWYTKPTDQLNLFKKMEDQIKVELPHADKKLIQVIYFHGIIRAKQPNLATNLAYV